MVDRISTGVPGLDEQIEGGFNKDSVMLLTGGPGSGKTIMSIQFILNGLENREKCLYITTEEMPDEIKGDARELGKNLDKYENFRMSYLVPTQNIGDEIEEMVLNQGYDRIVLDSLSVISMVWKDGHQTRLNTKDLINQLRKSDATAMLTAELANEEGKLSRNRVAEYIADGVIKLEGYSLGQSNFRSAQIIKMRRTDIDGETLSLELTDQGIFINKEDRF